MNQISKNYISEIRQILASARQKAYSAVNFAMVEAYWLIGKRIVEEEQHGKERAEYGEYVVKELSKALTAEFGKGFSERSVRQYRQFYQMFPEKTLKIKKIQLCEQCSHNLITRLKRCIPLQK
jgi:TPP-dependent indolepyruvate ferredoxin oxidoreductase alpha subunit